MPSTAAMRAATGEVEAPEGGEGGGGGGGVRVRGRRGGRLTAGAVAVAAVGGGGGRGGRRGGRAVAVAVGRRLGRGGARGGRHARDDLADGDGGALVRGHLRDRARRPGGELRRGLFGRGLRDRLAVLGRGAR